MIKELQLRVEPQFAYNEQALKETVSRQCGLDVRTITAVRTLKKSIDARQRTIFVNLTLRVFVNEQPPRDEFERIDYKPVLSLFPTGAGASSSKSQYLAPASMAAANLASASC